MSSWQTPSKARQPTAHGSPPATVGDRLIAAVAAPFAFNLALVLLAGLFRWRRGIAGLFVLHPALLVALVLVPAVVGLVSGIDRLAQFVGHSFFVNPPAERDARITIAIWGSLFACAYLLAVSAG